VLTGTAADDEYSHDLDAGVGPAASTRGAARRGRQVRA
jgi:hypothetical protein